MQNGSISQMSPVFETFKITIDNDILLPSNVYTECWYCRTHRTHSRTDRHICTNTHSIHFLVECGSSEGARIRISFATVLKSGNFLHFTYSTGNYLEER